MHALELPRDWKAMSASKPKGSLLVVGGGMTSAQLVVLGLKTGFKGVRLSILTNYPFQVVMASRSRLRTQQFDVSLDWVGRESNVMFSTFWSEPDFKSISRSRSL